VNASMMRFIAVRIRVAFCASEPRFSFARTIAAARARSRGSSVSAFMIQSPKNSSSALAATDGSAQPARCSARALASPARLVRASLKAFTRMQWSPKQGLTGQ